MSKNPNSHFSKEGIPMGKRHMESGSYADCPSVAIWEIQTATICDPTAHPLGWRRQTDRPRRVFTDGREGGPRPAAGGARWGSCFGKQSAVPQNVKRRVTI